MVVEDLMSMTLGEIVSHVALAEGTDGFREIAWGSADGPVYVAIGVGDSADLLRAILDSALEDGG